MRIYIRTNVLGNLNASARSSRVAPALIASLASEALTLVTALVARAYKNLYSQYGRWYHISSPA